MYRKLFLNSLKGIKSNNLHTLGTVLEQELLIR
jgi:hypothetical protein